MSELSREQVEALAEALHPRLGDGSCFHTGDFRMCRHQAEALAPTVAAMLAEARAEGGRRAWDEAADALSAEAVQVLRRFAQIAGVDGPTPAQRDGMRAALLWRADPAHPLARHASAAAGAPPEPSQASSGAEVHPESARPSDGRSEPPLWVEVTDKSLAEADRLAAGRDPSRVWIVYGECGMHEVYLTDNPEQPDAWGRARGDGEGDTPRLDALDEGNA